MLQVKNLSISYYSDEGIVRAVDDASFEIGQGEIAGLAGPSGCGKSTLGSALLRLVRSPGAVTGGSVILNGRDLLKLNEKEMTDVRGKEISMIFQDPFTSLNPVLTVGEQISECIRWHLKYDHAAAKAKALNLLEKVKLDDPILRYSQYPHELSGGMRQRAATAIALSCGAGLLIADEPTTSLDVTTQAQIMKLLLEIKDGMGTSILLISHNSRLVGKYCNRVIRMDKGRTKE